MTTIDISTILGADLRSRYSVHDLVEYFRNTDTSIVADFSKIQFATRSFIDEFYNVFIKGATELPFHIEITNMPENIKATFDSVSRTQTGVKTVPPTARVKQFASLDDLLRYMDSIPF
ncbi:MAG: hypothetical protein J6B13_04970 [Muribaculaceae bacterium]|nr:hypothetical protein [Muribaculaceae bacterium]